VLCDLGAERWPWPDSSVDKAVASHVLEHLPGDSFFRFLQELYRVTKHGAVTTVILPHPRHDIYLGDPTHVRPVLPATLIMFSPRYVKEMAERGIFLTSFGERYGVNFELDPVVKYRFDPMVDTKDPELDWKARHLNNVIFEWHGELRTVKP
jgi:SAM-dependent methyltransferase